MPLGRKVRTLKCNVNPQRAEVPSGVKKDPLSPKQPAMWRQEPNNVPLSDKLNPSSLKGSLDPFRTWAQSSLDPSGRGVGS